MEQIETPFKIQVDWETQYVFDVLPFYSSTRYESEFTILLDGVELGVLAMNLDTGWEWIESGFSKKEAVEIGEKIDNHYN